jgi:hypothetical protein
MVEESSESSKYLLLRYFGHGILFSVFGFVLGLVWAVILLGLVVVGALIGLIIGFILLFFVFSLVNAFLMDEIWSIQVKKNWMSLLFHGFALVIAFLFVSIPSFIISFYASSLPTAIVLFIIYCFIDGYVAKAVGSFWKEEGEASRATRRASIKLGYAATMIVLLITAMAGTGFAISLLLLVWLWLGGMVSEFLLFLAGLSGAVTLIGIIILSLFKRELEQEG